MAQGQALKIMLSGRDAEAKQSLIEYLQKDTDERLFQAITNWSGIAYIGFANTPDGQGFRDLWNIEADEQIVWKGKTEE